MFCKGIYNLYLFYYYKKQVESKLKVTIKGRIGKISFSANDKLKQRKSSQLFFAVYPQLLMPGPYALTSNSIYLLLQTDKVYFMILSTIV